MSFIYEDPDELGYSIDTDTDAWWPEFCGEHDIAYEECPECDGEGFWDDPEHGRQPCLNCIDMPGVVPHDCPAAAPDDEGAGE